MRNIIIIPTYNEKESIPPLLKHIFEVVPDIHVVVVDDNSPDGTATIVQTLSKQYSNLSLIKKSEKNGLGAAYKYVLDKIKQDSTIGKIITMDADGSHDPEILPEILKTLDNYNVVIGSRYVKDAKIVNWSSYRKSLSFYGNLYAKVVTHMPMRDLTAGFVGFHRYILNEIDVNSISSSGYAYQIDFKYLCYKVGATFTEIPIIFRERKFGASKITNSIIFEGIFAPIKLRYKKFK